MTGYHLQSDCELRAGEMAPSSGEAPLTTLKLQWGNSQDDLWSVLGLNHINNVQRIFLLV